jgi:hypothetical protein
MKINIENFGYFDHFQMKSYFPRHEDRTDVSYADHQRVSSAQNDYQTF